METVTIQVPSTGYVELEAIADELAHLAQELPYDSLLTLRDFGRFLRFLRQQQSATSGFTPANEVQPPLIHHGQIHYPLVRVKPAQLLELVGALPPIGGDALADTEAIVTIQPQKAFLSTDSTDYADYQ
jgi:hypothetical protein